jgi:glutamyl-tRNA(Gln) amidotransferase subunit E
MNGGIIEIKGAQDLGMLTTLIEYEAQRQATLIEIQEELKTRAVKFDDLKKDLVDVSGVFAKTESKILLNALQRGGKVYAVKLKGFNGLTGKELCPNRRLGAEMSDHAKFKGGVRGIFHTDELPSYKITQEELNKLRETMGAKSGDAVVIVADDESKCKAALVAVVDRAIQALSGVPAETRSANPDGTTRFTRPRPGAARMYPETDVKPTQVTAGKIEVLAANLPDMPEVKLAKYQEKYELNEKLAVQILDSEHLDLFEELAGKGLSTTLLAVTLTEDLTKLRRDGVPTDDLSQDAIRGTFMLVKDGTTVKESIPDMLAYLAKNPIHDAKRAITELGLEMMSDEEVKHLVESAVKEREDLVKDRGMKAMGPLMGVIMGKARGKASPQQVNKLLNAAIRAIIE